MTLTKWFAKNQFDLILSHNIQIMFFYFILIDPGVVNAVNVTLHTQSNGDCDATSITLRWTEPNLKNRNSNITKYSLQKMGSASILWRLTVPNPQPYSSTNREFTEILRGIFPAEQKDKYQVKLIFYFFIA